MSWEQKLVNAQVEVSRSVFEMNCSGHIKTDPAYKKEPDTDYIKQHITEAIKDLQASLVELDNQLNFKP
jgi:hypothetical protein